MRADQEYIDEMRENFTDDTVFNSGENMILINSKQEFNYPVVHIVGLTNFNLPTSYTYEEGVIPILVSTIERGDFVTFDFYGEDVL